MEREERIKQLEDEYGAMTRQLKLLLFDIRILCMEASSPLWERAKAEQPELLDDKTGPK